MKTSIKIILILVALFLVVGWRAARDLSSSLKDEHKSLSDLLWEYTVPSSKPNPIKDNQALYADHSKDTSVKTIYLVVFPTVDANNQTQTFGSMNLIKDYNLMKPELNAMFLDGDSLPDETIDQFLQTATLEANSTVTLRGHSTMTSEKKSYKIKLNKSTPNWQGQAIINLNKHPNDESRLRNKIAFDLFRLIPGMTSMQTQFVHLFVKDLANPAAGLVDYGLFTQIEQPDKAFLKAHELDENGDLYKANYFEFLRYPESLKNLDDPTYDDAAFAEHLQMCAGKNHEAILQMIDDVNNPSRDIDKVLDKYFDRDNYFTWLAVNILLGNYDTQTQNYILYRPHDQSTWYFLPWDYDGSMFPRLTDTGGHPVQLAGIANYWSNVLHSRVFMKQHNVELLNAKIDMVYKILTSEVMDQEVAQYQPLIEKYYLNDMEFKKEITADEFYQSIGYIKTIVSDNYQNYYATLEKPMPIFLGDIEQAQEGIRFFWSESFDLQGDRFSYTLQISRDAQFSDIIFEKNRLTTTSYIVDLQPGTYFWRITVIDAKGATQRAFDVYWEKEGDNNIHTGIYGIKKITIVK